MIRLSDVKVRMQYRWRVRQRLMVLHFARLHGPTAAARRFGVSVRTIRRWRVRWRQGGLEGLVPRYPRRRGRRVTPRVIELIGQARRELAYGASRTQLWLRRVHDVRVAMGTIQRIFRDPRPVWWWPQRDSNLCFSLERAAPPLTGAYVGPVPTARGPGTS